MIGFLEYVEDFEVFSALIAQALSWAKPWGLTALWGPFNLDYEDSYGLLIEGRDRPAPLMCGHTPPYDQDFMQRFGFGPARVDNLAFAAYPDSPAFRRLAQLADRFRKRGQITVRGADFAQLEQEIDRVRRLLNECLAQPFRQIADPELILFAEVEGETVGWFPAIPNLDEVFIRVDGLRRPGDYLKLWWLMRQLTKSLTIRSVLVRPEHWNTGVPVLLFDEMVKRAVPKGHIWADMSLTSEDNPSNPLLAKHAALELYKGYRVYRLMS
jgi:GNAT superfamily N-acetyltransferase